MTQIGALSRRQRRFLAALLTASSVRDAANAAGVSERAAWRYLADPAVKAELAQRQDAVLGQAARRLAGAMGQALTVLEEVMQSRTATDSAKVAAARGVLECGLRVVELAALGDRLAALEERLSEDGGVEA